MAARYLKAESSSLFVKADLKFEKMVQPLPFKTHPAMKVVYIL
jgi:hypothetical protein